MSGWTRAFALIFCGVAAAAGQAPLGWWFVALPAFAVAIALIAGANRPFLSGWLFGTAHFAAALHWIVEPFFVDAAATGWLALPALVAVAAGLALFWGVAGGIGRRAGGSLGVALALALAELARSYVLTGFPWALPGHVLIASPALPAASFAGAHGLTLAVLAGAGLMAYRHLGAVALGLAVWTLPFALALTLPPAPVADPGAQRVRLVQPNAPQHLKWDPAWMPIFFTRGLDATAAPSDGPVPDAVIWPETALPALLRDSDDLRATIAAASGGTPVVIGAQRYDAAGRPRNTMVVLDGAEGAIGTIHDKHRLVPFGEYLPLPRLFGAVGLGPLAAQLAGGYAPGDGPALVEVPGLGSVLPLICYEAIFPQDLRRVDRPRALLHLTNDAWFGTFAGPFQHLSLARLRAAESGLPLLRAANTGVSAMIDARGAIVAQIGLGQTGHLDVAVPTAFAPTPYQRMGDGPVGLLTLILLVGIAAWSRGKAVEGRGEHP
ncbi:MAG: apolipoprotein N-acyltransferase [Pseudomonadota bacterium]